MSSLITDTTSDLSEQPELELISQLADEASNRQNTSDVCIEGVEQYKPDPDDAVVAKDRHNKDEILKLRDSQLEEAGAVKFAFTYLSESSQAIQLRKSLPSEEVGSLLYSIYLDISVICSCSRTASPREISQILTTPCFRIHKSHLQQKMIHNL